MCGTEVTFPQPHPSKFEFSRETDAIKLSIMGVQIFTNYVLIFDKNKFVKSLSYVIDFSQLTKAV